MNQTQKTYKIILVGDGGVGKTSFIRRYTGLGETFERGYIPTLGVEVYHTTYIHPNRQITHFEVWDTAGQEKFTGLADAYYLQADACVFMYDRTSKLTSKSLAQWRAKINRVVPNIKAIVCASKEDIQPCSFENMNNVIKSTLKRGRTFAMKHNYPHISFSAKSKLGLLDIFRRLTLLCNPTADIRLVDFSPKPTTIEFNKDSTPESIKQNVVTTPPAHVVTTPTAPEKPVMKVKAKNTAPKVIKRKLSDYNPLFERRTRSGKVYNLGI